MRTAAGLPVEERQQQDEQLQLPWVPALGKCSPRDSLVSLEE
jgi:hypothetical protein